MVLITIINGVYKRTYNWGAPHCSRVYPIFRQTQVSDLGRLGMNSGSVSLFAMAGVATFYSILGGSWRILPRSKGKRADVNRILWTPNSSGEDGWLGEKMRKRMWSLLPLPSSKEYYFVRLRRVHWSWFLRPIDVWHLGEVWRQLRVCYFWMIAPPLLK